MDMSEFFRQKVYRCEFECGRCRIYDEPKVTRGPAWLLELQIQLQASGRRRNLIRLLEAASAIEYIPVTLEDVAGQFECEVISGAGPWAQLRPLLLKACRACLPHCNQELDLASLSAQQLDVVDANFAHYPGYVKRVVTGLRRTRARVDLRDLEAALTPCLAEN